MYVLVTCKNEEDPIINEGARVFTTFFHYKSMEIFSDAQGQLTIWRNFELVRDVMDVLVT